MTSPLARPPTATAATTDGASELEPRPRDGALAHVLREIRDVGEVVSGRRLALDVASRFLPDFTFAGVRTQLLRLSGCDIRRGVAIFGHVNLVGPKDAASNLRIGPGVLIGPDVTFCLDGRITIGRGVSIGPRAMLYTATHALGPSVRRMSPHVSAQPIVVEEGAWIGLAAIILPGVRVGRGSVVSAGAVVTKDVAPNTLVAGNPAVVVQELPA